MLPDPDRRTPGSQHSPTVHVTDTEHTDGRMARGGERWCGVVGLLELPLQPLANPTMKPEEYLRFKL